MTDGVTLGNGKSRKIKFADLPATYAEFVTAGEAGTLFIDLLMNALTTGDDAGWVALGDYLNKANLLSDATATALGLTSSATVNDALAAVRPVALGGTGANTVASARNALGLGNTAGAVPVANGGTGGTTKATARAALGITSGSAAPNDAVGDNGDIYFRYPA